MIRELGNVELFELCETLPKVQCSHCLLYWNQGICQICLKNSLWKQLSLVNDEEIIRLSHAKVYVFSDSVLCLGMVNQNRASNTLWEEHFSWFKNSPQYRTLETIDGEPMVF